MGRGTLIKKNIHEMKSLREIRNELLGCLLSLEEHYKEYADQEKIEYLDIETSEHLLNTIKTLMYHYQEEIPEMRTKRKWGEEMVRAEKLLKKYSEDPENESLVLNRKYDSVNYLEDREFFGEVTTSRPKLKKKSV